LQAGVIVELIPERCKLKAKEEAWLHYTLRVQKHIGLEHLVSEVAMVEN
jgi:hypothetical protein